MLSVNAKRPCALLDSISDSGDRRDMESLCGEFRRKAHSQQIMRRRGGLRSRRLNSSPTRSKRLAAGMSCEELAQISSDACNFLLGKEQTYSQEGNFLESRRGVQT
jgi:hypothetical protein